MSFLDSSIKPGSLPARGENRTIPLAAPLPQEVLDQLGPESFSLNGVQDQLDDDYITIWVNGRKDDQGNTLKYRFLINPENINVGRDMVDAQTLTRGGWQMGVWGENFIRITAKGTSGGQYFADGLTDQYEEYTESYRNLLALANLFENNGYWFEGESPDDGPLSAPEFRRRIKRHSDVVLKVGNFLWIGMFQSFSISESAQNPFIKTFSFNFIAWKERFGKNSPWLNIQGLESNTYYGHAFETIFNSRDKNKFLFTPIQGLDLSTLNKAFSLNSNTNVASLNGNFSLAQQGILSSDVKTPLQSLTQKLQF